MDLQLYLRVLWRFKFLIAAGVIVAGALAFLSYAKPSIRGTSVALQYRTSEYWEGDTTLLVTQGGFPWGRSTLPVQAANIGGQETAVPAYADPSRLSSLAVLYAQFANSDPVQALMLKEGPVHGTVTAAALQAPDGSGNTLPLIKIAAIAANPTAASVLSARAATAFRTYIQAQQDAADVPSRNRIVLQTLQRPIHPTLVRPRKMTLPILIFGTILIAVCGLALVLENLRPRRRPVAGVAASAATPDALKSA